MSSQTPPVPSFDQLLGPTLKALESLGGSATVEELNGEIVKILQLPDEVVNYRRERATINEVPYRAAWARTYLKKYGAVERTARGVWAITALGRGMTPEEIKQVPAKVRQKQAALRSQQEGELPAEDQGIAPEVEAEVATDWKESLLQVLMNMPPAAFERLAQRILRESGFVKVEVTGRSGDGGIDGIGVLRMRLISFQVLFQCKRYKDTVGAGAIRDFRGAMVGRTDKGLFITTGRFTPDARREATRDGAPPIELIDGEALCDLLKELKIGVATELVEVVKVRPEVFETI